MRIVNRRENLVARGKERIADKRELNDNAVPARVPAVAVLEFR